MTSSMSSSSLGRRSSTQAFSLPEPSAVCPYLEKCGYRAEDATTWENAPDQGDWPVLDIAVTGHEEIDKHTMYFVECSLSSPNSPWGADKWRALRRLRQLREDLHDRLRGELGAEAFKKLLPTAFAPRGGLRGTTAALNAWCGNLAKIINNRQVAPRLVAFVLQFIEAPECLAGSHQSRPAEPIVRSAETPAVVSQDANVGERHSFAPPERKASAGSADSVESRDSEAQAYDDFLEGQSTVHDTCLSTSHSELLESGAQQSVATASTTTDNHERAAKAKPSSPTSSMQAIPPSPAAESSPAQRSAARRNPESDDEDSIEEDLPDGDDDDEDAPRVIEQNSACVETERLASEAAAKVEADRLAAEAAAKAEEDRLAAEAAAKAEADQLAAKAAAKAEEDRLAADASAEAEEERVAAEAAAKAEADRVAAEAAAKAEKDRLAADALAKVQAERLPAESVDKAETEKLSYINREAEGERVDPAAVAKAENTTSDTEATVEEKAESAAAKVRADLNESPCASPKTSKGLPEEPPSPGDEEF